MTMKPSCWPDWLDHIRAKSPEMGGESLAEHTWQVLAKLGELAHLRPTLPALVGEPRLWHCLFWACLLHDFGKAAAGFQAMLGGAGRWRQRHEVLSLAFVDWIAPELDDDEVRWIVSAIVSHHRDASEIARTYDAVDPDPLEPLLAELDPATVQQLWRWLNECATNWMQTLNLVALGARPLALLPVDTAVAAVCNDGVANTRRWLDNYADWIDDLRLPQPGAHITLQVLLRGLTTNADHMASAHLDRMPHPVQEAWQQLAGRILRPGQTPYMHQSASAAYHGRSAILIAPTGSGKTEAALYWALGDGSHSVQRLFYALPFQASMNAMFDRLKDKTKGFGAEAVGIQHGRALQAMYARLVDHEHEPPKAAALAGWAKNINLLNARPVKVFSPYQMLKAAFQLRGFEGMFSDYAQASFIFDEIHAYEPGRLALILGLVAYLREHYGAQFFVMSATFPCVVREKLAAVLGDYAHISADADVFKAFRRHRLQLLDGELIDTGIALIAADVRAGRQVLVCVNTVKRAQEVRSLLRDAGLRDDQLLLIHSRYIGHHRTRREAEIMVRCGIGADSAQRGFALIATQVVEVSLNIDLDVIYSDPAPLEALLQRFGRVNRARQKGICPVYVFRAPDDGQGVYGRHVDPQQNGHIVRVTMAELERHNGQEIDEAQIDSWLDAIYSDPQLATNWEAAYQRVSESARLLLAGLRPFESDKQKEEQFEELFDNIDVLPACFEADYLRCIADGQFIEASGYFVGISARNYAILAKQGLVRPAASDSKRARWVVRLPYSEAFGLSLDSNSAVED
jgi:CRISPR-associated endonuclease/helicase Cas3